MKHEVTNEELMRLLDDELEARRAGEVRSHLERCAECRREYEVFGALKRDMTGLAPAAGGRSVWLDVHQRLTRPVGWILFLAGMALWTMWAAYAFVTAPGELVEKLAVGAIVIGLLMLLVSVIAERLAEWKTDPYRHIQR